MSAHPRSRAPWRLRLRRRAARGERGAILVELVMITPVILAISLGSIDLGLAWRASITISGAARSGARVASALGINDTADHAALKAVGAALGTIPSSEIDVVVIYNATSVTGTVPSNCLTAAIKTAGGSATDKCNVYSGTTLSSLLSDPTAALSWFTGSCGGTRKDRFWCAPNRLNTQTTTGGLDYVGVFIRINHATTTKMFGSTMTLTDSSVMRIEPNAGNP